MKINDILAEFETPVTIKRIDIVDLVLYNGAHYCTMIHYWPNLQSMTVTYYSEQAYNTRYESKYVNEYLIKTIFHLPVEASDIIEAETVPVCPF